MAESKKALADERIDQVDQSDALVSVLAAILAIVGRDRAPADKIEELSATITAHGGLAALQQACEERAKQSRTTGNRLLMNRSHLIGPNSAWTCLRRQK